MATTTPDVGQVATYGQFPLSRLQRAGASAGQITTAQTWWNSASSTLRVQHGMLIEQVPDSEVLALAGGSWPVATISSYLHVANQPHD